jgi:hypothetical protein
LADTRLAVNMYVLTKLFTLGFINAYGIGYTQNGRNPQHNSFPRTPVFLLLIHESILCQIALSPIPFEKAPLPKPPTTLLLDWYPG